MVIKQCKNCMYCNSIMGKEVYCRIKGTLLMKDDTDDIYCLDYKELYKTPEPSQPKIPESQLSQCEDCAYRLAWLPGKIRCKHKGIITSSSDIPYTTCEYYDKKDEEDFQMPKDGTTIKVPLRSENFVRFKDDADKTTFFDVVEFLTWNLPSNPTYLVGDMLKHLMNYNVHRDTTELEMISACLKELVKYENGDKE